MKFQIIQSGKSSHYLFLNIASPKFPRVLLQEFQFDSVAVSTLPCLSCFPYACVFLLHYAKYPDLSHSLFFLRLYLFLLFNYPLNFKLKLFFISRSCVWLFFPDLFMFYSIVPYSYLKFSGKKFMVGSEPREQEWEMEKRETRKGGRPVQGCLTDPSPRCAAGAQPHQDLPKGCRLRIVHGRVKDESIYPLAFLSRWPKVAPWVVPSGTCRSARVSA